MRSLVVAGLVACSAHLAVAQCPGDFNENGTVEINELVTAVGHALRGCATPTPITPVSCPQTFAFGPGCTFHGPFNAGCPERTVTAHVEVTYAGFVDIALDTTPPVHLTGSVSNPLGDADRARLIQYHIEGGAYGPMSGPISLLDEGRRLRIAATQRFAIDGCAFSVFDGTAIP